jgi:hypothetical protein
VRLYPNGKRVPGRVARELAARGKIRAHPDHQASRQLADLIRRRPRRV